MIHRSLAAVLLASAVLCAGCAGPARVVHAPNLRSSEVLARVAERNGRIGTLRGDGSITIESPERSNNGGFDLNLRKPDSVRVEFSGPLGIRVGTLMLAREEFVFYNSLDNKAVIGAPDGATLGAMFNLTMKFDEILHAFTGEFGAVLAADSLERFSMEEGTYLLVYRAAGRTKEYRVDGETFVVTSYRLLDASGKSELTAIASDIELDGETAMPHLIRVIFPLERRSITIAYDGVKVNEPVDCAFSLPERAVVYRR